jgi:hypothetical protein
MNTKRVGNIAEAKALAAFVSRSWVVLLPFGDNEPYDLVIDRGAGFERVQVKSAWPTDNGCITFNAYSIPGRSKDYTQTSYTGKADLFAVYNPLDDQVYLIPVDGLGSRPSLRLDPPGKAHPGMRYAKDYKI